MKELVPLLRVRDLDETIEFYTNVLGFELCWREDDTASLKCGRVGLLFSTGSNLGDEPQLSGTLYFYPDSVDEMWNKLRGKAQVEWPLEQMSYGTREFGVRDCNGYILAFAEVDETAQSADAHRAEAT